GPWQQNWQPGQQRETLSQNNNDRPQRAPLPPGGRLC
uniref:Uncharacterized protein n=1 Tax=Macaca fascicularis TaxID=9541 RepID=A0A7N9D646_MACFA